jgi:hypothetical protein
MHSLRAALALVIALLAGASAADAQRATERFIPLGQSPGVSGNLSVIGTIVAVDVEQRRIHLAGPTGPGSVTLRDTTPIWIDRHELGLGATAGSFEDCQKGRSAEVKYADPDTRQFAEWIKLRVRAAEP